MWQHVAATAPQGAWQEGGCEGSRTFETKQSLVGVGLQKVLFTFSNCYVNEFYNFFVLLNEKVKMRDTHTHRQTGTHRTQDMQEPSGGPTSSERDSAVSVVWGDDDDGHHKQTNTHTRTHAAQVVAGFVLLHASAW